MSDSASGICGWSAPARQTTKAPSRSIVVQPAYRVPSGIVIVVVQRPISGSNSFMSLGRPSGPHLIARGEGAELVDRVAAGVDRELAQLAHVARAPPRRQA